MSKQKIGVLVMSYGTPEDMEQVESYYTHIRRGHPPSIEQLEDLKKRYAAIGGVFPLRENTNQQVACLEQTLNASQSTYTFQCFQGLKHASPLIEDGITEMSKQGIKKAIGIVLAPHYSIMSVGEYMKRAQLAAEEQGINIRFVKSYHTHPQLIEALTERAHNSLQRFEPTEREQVRILFTAHSLPEKIVEMNDPYVEQLTATSKAIIAHGKISNSWQFAWQSAGQTSIPWLGPDILDVLQELATEGVKQVLICPVGFVSDHLEILYDLDIEAQKAAKQLDIHLERTPSLNTDQRYMQTMTDAILQELKGMN